MSNDPQFWTRSRKNLNNPTFASSQVLSSLQPKNFEDISSLKSMKIESKSQIYKSSKFNLPSLKQFKRSNSQMQRLNPESQAPMVENGKSIMRNYSELDNSLMLPSGITRSNSYTNFKTDAKDIFQYQEKNFNIINLKAKQFKSSINLFPKYRLERQDSDYKLRQAFLKGDINTVSKLSESIKFPQIDKSSRSPLLDKFKKSFPNFENNQKLFVNNSSKLQWKF